MPAAPWDTLMTEVEFSNNGNDIDKEKLHQGFSSIENQINVTIHLRDLDEDRLRRLERNLIIVFTAYKGNNNYTKFNYSI